MKKFDLTLETDSSPEKTASPETAQEQIARLNSAQVNIGTNETEMGAEIFRCEGKQEDFDY